MMKKECRSHLWLNHFSMSRQTSYWLALESNQYLKWNFLEFSQKLSHRYILRNESWTRSSLEWMWKKSMHFESAINLAHKTLDGIFCLLIFYLVCFVNQMHRLEIFSLIYIYMQKSSRKFRKIQFVMKFKINDQKCDCNNQTHT